MNDILESIKQSTKNTMVEHLGIEFDTETNNQRSSEPFCISTKESKIAVWVIPTNEELAIALQTQELIA